MTTKLFVIEIGEDQETRTFLANVISTTDNKGKSVQGVSLRCVLAEVNKVVRKKVTQMRRFPVPEPSRIIGINGGHPSIIMPSRN